AVETLLDGLEGKRLLCHWASPMLELLGRAFGGRTLHSEREPDRTIIEACRLLRDAAAGLAAMPEKLCPIVSAAEAMQLLLGQVAGGNIAAPAGDDTIELLGWLELPLDDAPVLVITSLNEGVIPSSRNADMFLPNQLRRQLGVEDNERRYARDAYSLSVLLASRARLHLVAARRNADGDPRMPSRLLFACPPKTIAERALRFFRPERIEARPLGVLRPGTGPVFTPPRPAPLPKPVEAMSVTEFRDYLACPYRYYLRRRLRLEQVSDVAEELDGGQFGSLVHAVLGDFGLGKKRDSHDPDEIDAFLIVALERHAEKQYGRAPRAAVRVQLEQLKRRLHAFAVWQAGHAAEGWHIECVEVSPPEGSAKLRVDNKDMILHGRIDRIDHHDDGRRLLLDYKTADKAADPDTAHRHGQEWIDLQLPLYRHLLDGLKLEPPTVGEVLLGYIVLPKNASGASLVLGPWAQADLDAADAAAATVVRGVRGEKFWPPARPAPKYFDEFAAICLDDQLLRRVTETEETEAAAGGEAE
ncbi:MAG: PD-(D/E)XK nuclease family protein, partial [Planctomycetota bacterium]